MIKSTFLHQKIIPDLGIDHNWSNHHPFEIELNLVVFWPVVVCVCFSFLDLQGTGLYVYGLGERAIQKLVGEHRERVQELVPLQVWEQVHRV